MNIPELHLPTENKEFIKNPYEKMGEKREKREKRKRGKVEKRKKEKKTDSRNGLGRAPTYNRKILRRVSTQLDNLSICHQSIPKSNGTYVKGNIVRKKRTTRGWKLLVQWKDNTITCFFCFVLFFFGGGRGLSFLSVFKNEN